MSDFMDGIALVAMGIATFSEKRREWRDFWAIFLGIAIFNVLDNVPRWLS